MTKRLYLTISLLFSCIIMLAQPVRFATAITDNQHQGMSNGKGSLVAGLKAGNVFWAVPQSTKLYYGEHALGDYNLMLVNGEGLLINNVLLVGKADILQCEPDNKGNWYLLGFFLDTVKIGNKTLISSGISGSNYFFAKISGNAMQVEWIKYSSTNNYASVPGFFLHQDNLYFPTDSFNVCTVYRMDENGNRSVVLKQKNTGYTSSLVMDSQGNTYIAGSCVNAMPDFNGKDTMPPSYMQQYNSYIVKYDMGGMFEWIHFMSDITCTQRKITLADDHTIYYTGALNDTLHLEGFSVKGPSWVYDFVVAQMDETGKVNWIRELKNNLDGDASINTTFHAATLEDKSINILANARRYNDFGNGISITSNGRETMVLNIDKNGLAQWVEAVESMGSEEKYIVSNAYEMWITGWAIDSSEVKFDGLFLPAQAGKYLPFLAKISTRPLAANTFMVRRISSLYPNPAKDEIVISCPLKITKQGQIINTGGVQVGAAPAQGGTFTAPLVQEFVEVRLFDIQGRELRKEKLPFGILKINISDLAKGYYLVEVISSAGREIHKLVKE